MKAIKVRVAVGRDHKIVVDVPADTPEGMAEGLVLVPERSEPLVDLTALLAEFGTRPGGRATAEIDSELAVERAGWK